MSPVDALSPPELCGSGVPNLVEVLRWRAAQQGAQEAFLYLADGEIEIARLSYAELDRKSRAIAAALQARNLTGERVLLIYPSGLEFIAALLGCLYAGVVAVPSYPPKSEDRFSVLAPICRDARPAAVLTQGVRPRRERDAALPSVGPIPWIATDEIDLHLAEQWQSPALAPNDLAFLQFTSGSTSVPRGVRVTHSSLLHNEEMIRLAFGQSARSVIVGWLPLYHDMGLIGNVLHSLYVGARCVLMSPLAFLQRPVRWLNAITRYRATTSGGPDFAYSLCARRISPAQREELDLSSWSLAFTGAEPVRAETLDQFSRAFAPHGFHAASFYPCYGLAEATLFVSGGQPGAPGRRLEVAAAALERNEVEPAIPGAPARLLTGCGAPWLGQQVAIVDPETARECPPRRIGEIWVAGPSVADGYWNRNEESLAVFGARLKNGEGPFLRTGDLGFFADGHLFVTGRLKDLVIVRGRNHYPQDLEWTSQESHPALRTQGTAAFSVEVDREERLVIVQEIGPRQTAAVETAGVAVRTAVAEAHGIAPYEVILIRSGTLPRTSSGKVRRRACRDAYREGVLEAVWRSGPDLVGVELSDSGPELLTIAIELGADGRRQAVEAVLRDEIARRLGMPHMEVALGRTLWELGLDSLAMAALHNSVAARTGVQLTARELFEDLPADRLAAEIAARLASATPAPMPSAPISESPLSYGQRALHLVEQLAPQAAPYNLALAARVEGALDIGALARALRRLIDRHPALRTTLSPRGNEIRQIVHGELAPEVRIQEAVTSTRLAEQLCREAYRPFDLDRGPLVRVVIWPGREGGTAILFVLHHALCDFRSLAILARELSTFYAAELSEGVVAVLDPPGMSYAAFACWQELWLAGPEGERLWQYWSERLAGELPVLELGTDHPRPRAQTYCGASRSARLEATLLDRLRSWGIGQQATLFMSLLSAFAALLARRSEQSEVLIGAPNANRNLPGLTGTVGYFVNPLVLRLQPEVAAVPSSLLTHTREVTLGSLKHQDLPFALLVERLRPQRHASIPPLFQAMMVLQGGAGEAPDDLPAFSLGVPGARLALGGLELLPLPLSECRVPVDVVLMAAESRGGLELVLQYNVDLFDPVSIERLLGHLVRLLETLPASARPLGEIELLSPAERAEIEAWSQSEVSGAPDCCLHELFAAQAARDPEGTAIICSERRVTYGELDHSSARLAARLRILGVGPEVRVGLCAERSPEMACGLLAILRAGGAYVPLDPDYPTERLAFMLADSGAALLLTESHRDLPPAVRGCPRVGLEPVSAGGAASPSAEACASPQNLAYLIYTSGSSGRPKGVAIEHRSAVAFARWVRDTYSREELSGVLASTSICFDLSVFELLVPLCWGGKVVLAENVLSLASLPAAREVTLVNTVPSAMTALLRETTLPSSVVTVNLAGESLRRELVRDLHSQPGVRRVFNLYGPSEATTYSTWALQVADTDDEPPIGRPIAGTQAYLFDALGWLAPPGAVAELFLGGEGLARGYEGQAVLTAERFLPNPCGPTGSRLYRTGDLARRGRDGALRFLGRRDHQVKLRGFRIELGEIDATLALHPTVAAAVSVLRSSAGANGAGGWLITYAELRRPRSAEEPEARDWLASRLPAHCVPNRVAILERLPRTPNGKVDRKALPELADLAHESLYMPPRTATESLVVEIWQELLGSDRIGIEDDFFAAGGHSLLATRLVGRAARDLRRRDRRRAALREANSGESRSQDRSLPGERKRAFRPPGQTRRARFSPPVARPRAALVSRSPSPRKHGLSYTGRDPRHRAAVGRRTGNRAHPDHRPPRGPADHAGGFGGNHGSAVRSAPPARPARDRPLRPHPADPRHGGPTD